MSLSKSNYLKGIQCEKALYLHLNHPELKAELTEEQEARFEAGHQTGKLAQDLFPGGVDASRGDFQNVSASVAYTSELIQSGQKVIYEAAFMYNERFCYLDILVKDQEGWKAYEVKGSTSVKDYHYHDGAFQYYVITNSGLPLTDFSIVHLNNQYVRQGPLEVNRLFTIESLAEVVSSMQSDVEQNSGLLLKMMAGDLMPTIDIGTHCHDPFTCDFCDRCWQHVPEYSVFNIARLKAEKKFDLYRSGYLEFKDIPKDYPLNEKQWFQIDSELNGTVTRDQAALNRFKVGLVYPLYFLDFETFQLPIPLYDNTRPYQQLTFQYSLHIQEYPNGPVAHHEYLGSPPEDPRPGLIKKLINDLGDTGSIVVYNSGFETGRLRELARDFPEYETAIEEVLTRIVDLMDPFRSKHLYTPDMQGSYSIKKVLPALVPQMTYNDLDVQEGGMASLTYASLYEDKDESSRNAKREGLLEYCKMDTLAMVEILKIL